MSIFISWSGEKTGKNIGELLKLRLIDWLGLNDDDCYMSNRDMRAGDWRANLRAEVQRAEVGIVVLTREARHSEWIRWEVGGIEVNTKSIKNAGDARHLSPIFPILFGAAKKEDFSGGVFSFQQFFNFTRDEITRLLLEVKTNLNINISNASLRTSIDTSWAATLEQINEILNEAHEVDEIQVEGVFQKAQATLRGAISARGTDPEVIEGVLSSLENDDLARQIAEITRTYYQCREQGRQSVIWKQIWAEHTWNSIMRTAESLRKAQDGEITLSSEEAGIFWRRTIMQSVSKSIWTTNLGGHGRRTDSSLNAAQEKAIGRKVTIQRLFVYNEMNEEEINGLRPVMNAQLEIGIQVHVLPRNLFDEYARTEIPYIGSPDFMLIDDEIVYVTNLAGKDILGVTLKDNPGILKRVRELKSELMSAASRVTMENINDFPNFLQRR